MMKTIGRWFLWLCGILFLAACGLIGGNQVDPCAINGALFQDDFEQDTLCGWALYNQEGAVTAVEEGVLRISTSQPGQIWWTNPARSFENTIITVEVRQIDGPDDNAYGVICRYQDANNFYIFLISGDGFYAIGKYESGSPQIAYLSGEGQYQFSEVINQGAAANQIRVACIENELTLSVNGLPLATVSDSSFVNGDIGLGVSTLAPGTAVVQFDNVQVIAP